MAEPIPVVPAKLFAAVLFVSEERLSLCRDLLSLAFGEIDFASPFYPFDFSDYYVPELGEPIRRVFLSFKKLLDPARLREAKLTTNRIEQQLAIAGKRSVNIDPGYLDYGKVVLASMKPNTQKIYLGDGVYADLNLIYEKGHYRPFIWTFPDFRERTYEPALLQIRTLYKAALRVPPKSR